MKPQSGFTNSQNSSEYDGQFPRPRRIFLVTASEANVGERLAVRNLFDELRGGGKITGGPANFTAKVRHAFANQLDRWPTAARD